MHVFGFRDEGLSLGPEVVRLATACRLSEPLPQMRLRTYIVVSLQPA